MAATMVLNICLKHPVEKSYREENFNLHVIYRVPSSSVIVFCHELLGIIEQEINETCNTLYIGGFLISIWATHIIWTPSSSLTSSKASI